MPENPIDPEIKEVVDNGIPKAIQKKALTAIFTFFKNHGVSVNTILLVCMIVVGVWYGRPLYDKFNRLPQKVEINEKRNNKQDSLLRDNDVKENKQNVLLNKQFDKIEQNFLTIIRHRNADKKLLEEAVKNNRIILNNSTKNTTTPIEIEHDYLIEEDTINNK